MPTIRELRGFEILDSRGRPTVLARCTLGGGEAVEASVPSGASTGRAEAVELRDGDPQRYRGLGCRQAAANIGGALADRLVGRSFDGQAELDAELVAIDGSPDRSRLGANALLAVSVAFARASARQRSVPLYRHFGELAGLDPAALRLPRATINLFSGGKHAGGQVPLQDVLVVPRSPTSVDDALAMTAAVYHAASDIVRQRYGRRALVADEGGLAPPFSGIEAMFDDAVAAIEGAGLRPGVDVVLAIDVAASHFYEGGSYHLPTGPLSGEAMVAQLLDWLRAYPIVSVEDGLAEEDWRHWSLLRSQADPRVRVLGDDLLCTQPTRIERAQAEGAADALLLKVNQIGTLTEAAASLAQARSAGWSVTVSARSGETEDDWLADLAVGWRGDFIKIGSITRSERLAKYNRLLLIERETGAPLAEV
jgi:enolase